MLHDPAPLNSRGANNELDEDDRDAAPDVGLVVFEAVGVDKDLSHGRNVNINLSADKKKHDIARHVLHRPLL